jgi:hypothetical protein
MSETFKPDYFLALEGGVQSEGCLDGIIRGVGFSGPQRATEGDGEEPASPCGTLDEFECGC